MVARLTAKQKQQRLFEWLRAQDRVAIAFSGGVDSTYLLHAAVRALGEDRVLALTLRLEVQAASEKRSVQKIPAGVCHLMVDADPFAIPGFCENMPDRCYHCKFAMFRCLLDTARKRGFSVLVDGSNADDAGDFRPGRRALRALDILSPLADAGLTKLEIRELSREMALSTWDQPSQACLASRIPYGTPITRGAIAQVGRAEEVIWAMGYRNVRVRHHGDLARIEMAPEDFPRAMLERERLVQICRDAGFLFVALDLEGFQSGRMNRSVDLEIQEDGKGAAKRSGSPVEGV